MFTFTLQQTQEERLNQIVQVAKSGFYANAYECPEVPLSTLWNHPDLTFPERFRAVREELRLRVFRKAMKSRSDTVVHLLIALHCLLAGKRSLELLLVLAESISDDRNWIGPVYHLYTGIQGGTGASNERCPEIDQLTQLFPPWVIVDCRNLPVTRQPQSSHEEATQEK